jgi:hypothetical protein
LHCSWKGTKKTAYGAELGEDVRDAAHTLTHNPRLANAQASGIILCEL